MTRKKKLLLALSVVSLGAVAAGVCSWVVSREAGRTFNTVAEMPANRVGLLLGCSKIGRNGGVNPFFSARMEAAAQLWAAGKIQYVLVSGDNHRADYDEPEDMKQALLALGVPADRIVCDYAGFTTLDSVVRCKEVFGQTAITVISQQFHNERAIYIARARGMEAVGFNAEGVGMRRGLLVYAREAAARTRAVWDVKVWGRKPKFLGEPIVIGAAEGT